MSEYMEGGWPAEIARLRERAEQAERALAEANTSAEFFSGQHAAAMETVGKLCDDAEDLRTQLHAAQEALEAYEKIYQRLSESHAQNKLDSDVWYALTKAHGLVKK